MMLFGKKMLVIVLWEDNGRQWVGVHVATFLTIASRSTDSTRKCWATTWKPWRTWGQTREGGHQSRWVRASEEKSDWFRIQARIRGGSQYYKDTEWNTWWFITVNSFGGSSRYEYGVGKTRSLKSSRLVTVTVGNCLVTVTVTVVFPTSSMIGDMTMLDNRSNIPVGWVFHPDIDAIVNTDFYIHLIELAQKTK